MPTDTFLKLPEEKKKKIVSAAKKEFSRVSLEEASIKNIVEEAEIARGSFYQYFADKDDLLQYVVQLPFHNVETFIENQLQKADGDPFKWFLALYDYLIKECFTKQEIQFYKKVFGDVKTKEDTFFIPKDKFTGIYIEKMCEQMDPNLLDIENKKDAKLIMRILSCVTKKAIVLSFNYTSKEEAREDYIRELDYLKYGMMRKEREGKPC